MKRMVSGLVGIGVGLMLSVGVSALGQAHEEHEHAGAAMQSGAAESGKDQTLTGEVVDVLEKDGQRLISITKFEKAQ